MALLVSKVPFWEGGSKGGIICDAQKLCSAENSIFIVCSAKHSFAEIKECNLKQKQTFTKNWGLFANMRKGVYFVCFLVWGCFVFFGLEKNKKAIFLQFQSFFSSLCSPKTCLWSPSFLLILFCFLVFLLSSLSNFHIFFGFCPSTSFERYYSFGFFCLSFFVALPLFMFACFFQTNFPNIPFLKPELLACLAVSLFILLLLFSCFMFLPFCFYAGFVFGILFILLLFCFTLLLVLLSDYQTNIVFPAILVFLVILVTR